MKNTQPPRGDQATQPNDPTMGLLNRVREVKYGACVACAGLALVILARIEKRPRWLRRTRKGCDNMTPGVWEWELGPLFILWSLGPSHLWRTKSQVSLRDSPCAHDVVGTPYAHVRYNCEPIQLLHWGSFHLLVVAPLFVGICVGFVL